jgi:RND superfamily putative drug exporter
LSTLARWCFRHRFVVALLWVALLAGLGLAASQAGTKSRDRFSLPGTESTKALDLLEDTMPGRSGACPCRKLIRPGGRGRTS